METITAASRSSRSATIPSVWSAKRVFRPTIIAILLQVSAVQAAESAKASSGGARVVSQVVAQVGSQLVTSREVKISFALDRAMAAASGHKKGIPLTDAAIVLHENSSQFREHLNLVLTEYLIKGEADSFSVAQVSESAVKESVAKSLSALRELNEFRRLEVAPREMEQILLRRLASNQFLKFKSDAAGVIVSDEEVKAYFLKNGSRFGPKATFTEYKDTIKEVLEKRQLDEKLHQWFETLKHKYRLRVLKYS